MERPICKQCDKRPCQPYKKTSGEIGYISLCSTCKGIKFKRGNQNSKQRRYRKFKKEVCESCSFIPVHVCQLDVDHIDGNHDNNDPKNLITLCANCHRLKNAVKQRFHEQKENMRSSFKILIRTHHG